MGKYFLERNEKLYFRRRIPQSHIKYFENMHEVRIQLAKTSQFQGIMIIETLNKLFEELLTMIFLDRNNEKDAIIMDYLSKMKQYATSDEEPKIITYSIKQFMQEQDDELNQQLQDKIQQLDLTKRKKLLNNLDTLDNFIQVIDPKQDFKAHLQSNPAQETKQIKSNITLRQLYELYKKEKKQDNPTLTKTTWRDYEASFNDFVFVVKDADTRDISSFTKENFRTFLEALHNNLPISRTKKPEYRNLSYEELKKLTIIDDQKMATNTKQKRILTIKQIFDIAIDPRYGYLEKNLSTAFLIKSSKGRKTAKIDRVPLTKENLHKLFHSKYFTHEREHTLAVRAEKFWIPTIALYSGMRQNEICQLKIEDVKYEVIDTGEKIWYFDINNNDDKSLKNDNAPRFVPIHPRLVSLGFIDYFKRIKDKHTQVFPNLRYHPVEGKYNTDFGKSFMKFFRRHITIDKTQVFHCLRHNVSDQLLKNAVHHRLPKDLMNRLLGHKPDNDTTSVTYSQGYGVKELYEGIKTLDFGDLI